MTFSNLVKTFDDASIDLFAYFHAKELEKFVNLIEKESKFLGEITGPEELELLQRKKE